MMRNKWGREQRAKQKGKEWNSLEEINCAKVRAKHLLELRSLSVVNLCLKQKRIA